MKTHLISCLVATVLSGLVFATPAQDADRAELLKGVTAVNTGGMPGGVSAFGQDAFALFAGKDGKQQTLLPVAAATRWELGRVVAFGHDGFLGAVDQAQTGTLLLNVARWITGNAQNPRIGVVNNPALVAHLKANGFDAVALEPDGWKSQLTGLKGLCMNAITLKPDDLTPVEEFVRSGGGLAVGVTGWGWGQIYRKSKVQLALECPANLLLRRAGIAFSASTPGRTLQDAYAVGGDLSLLGASAALQAISDHSAGRAKLTPEQAAQCGATLADAIRSLQSDDENFLSKVGELTNMESVLPTAASPLRSRDAFERAMISCNTELLKLAKPAGIKAHPAAKNFPGAVPDGAPRINDRLVEISTAVPRWHSTGLYAAPGEVIRVTVPPEVVAKGYGVRIGCHTDSLWHLDEWKRIPEISRRDSLDHPDTTVASAFGGLIYIDVPGNAPPATLRFTISGAVKAPRFILGKTTVEDWKKSIRDFPAPWAELETSKIILSVPSEKIRQLEDPDELMTLWDRIMDAEADLAAIPRERKSPERIVPDVQISAGYMHSGYPIMTWMDGSVETSLSTGKLSQGSWGHFHELGHNHQQGDWTFDGTVEVTCNLFSLYVMETVCGMPPGQGHVALEPAERDKRFRDYLTLSDKWPKWKSDPFLALTMYDQLRTGFGWDTFKKVFAEYRALPKSERPGNDDQKRDQWLVRFSRATGKNLGPFFEAWGVPTSQAARDSIKDLPAWMPPDWPQK